MKTKLKRKTVYREGQSIIEYIILLAVVIAALVVFFGPTGRFAKYYESMISTQGRDMLNKARAIF